MKQNSHNSTRKHTSKQDRTPRVYKDVKRVLNEMLKNKIDLMKITGSLKMRRVSRVESLSRNVLKQWNILQKVLSESQLLQKEPHLDPTLALIFAYKILYCNADFSNPCIGFTKVRDHEAELRAALEKLQGEEEGALPRYARVNTLLTTREDVIAALAEDGFVHLELGPISFKRYMRKIRRLSEEEFVVDVHCPDVLTFSSSVQLRNHWLVQQSHIFLQDKSSNLSVLSLAPPPGSVVLDACAAPGLKTLHLAAIMEDSGQIFAGDINEERTRTLESFVKQSGTTICKVRCLDFLELDVAEESVSQVEYILLDVPCSGSGMARRSGMEESDPQAYQARLARLSNLQAKLLRHAFRFPAVRRIVYSTCSVNEQENEALIQQISENIDQRFALKPCLPDWPIRGNTSYSCGNLCIRASPKLSCTNGFFVAMFERVDDDYDEA